MKKIEIESLISIGAFNAVFTTKKSHYLIRIPLATYGNTTTQQKYLEEKYNVLSKHKIPVPKTHGVCEIVLPDHIQETINRAYSRGLISSFNKRRGSELFIRGEKRIGLLFEYIDHDISLISKARLIKIYTQNREYLSSLNIITGHDTYMDSELMLNVLWSKSKAELYFIDIGDWVIPETLY